MSFQIGQKIRCISTTNTQEFWPVGCGLPTVDKEYIVKHCLEKLTSLGGRQMVLDLCGEGHYYAVDDFVDASSHNHDEAYERAMSIL